jgi:hypothetical protein
MPSRHAIVRRVAAACPGPGLMLVSDVRGDVPALSPLNDCVEKTAAASSRRSRLDSPAARVRDPGRRSSASHWPRRYRFVAARRTAVEESLRRPSVIPPEVVVVQRRDAARMRSLISVPV